MFCEILLHRKAASSGRGEGGGLTPDLGHAQSSTTLGKRDDPGHGTEELLRRVPSAGGRLVRVHAGRADDLGVERGTLRHWLELFGTGKKTAADGTPARSPLSTARASGRPAKAAGDREPETPEQELARLRARVAELEAETTKLSTEREILRSAAKYFAGETRW